MVVVPGEEHIPVLMSEVMEYLAPKQGEYILDGTLGGAGHSERILKELGPEGFLIGLDRDSEIIESAKAKLSKVSDRFRLLHSNYSDIGRALKKLQAEYPENKNRFESVDGILLDIGVSSMQIDNGTRGFSFSQDGPLDMRMDRKQGVTAESLIKTLPERELARIIKEYGEERFARRIAGKIAEERQAGPIKTTAQLAELVRRCVRGHEKIHPATRTFQALRIAVNNELAELESFLRSFPEWLRPGGRVVIISFHSLEDRLVKNRFRELASTGGFELLTRKVIKAGDEELQYNARSRSAKLRAIKKQ